MRMEMRTMRTCTIDGCDREIYAKRKGLCRKHYEQQYYGTVEAECAHCGATVIKDAFKRQAIRHRVL